MKNIILSLMFFSVVSAWAAAPANSPLKEYNPDIGKFAFAKSFITALGYYGRVDRRLLSEQEIGDRYDRDLAVLKTLVDNRTLDNTELRIAKNYLPKYLDSKNMLIRKVAYDAMIGFEQNIRVSSAEKRLWQAYHRYTKAGLTDGLNEKDFKAQMSALARDRKAAGLSVLRTVLMLKKVVLSAAACTDEQCTVLALTQSERDKLVKILDGFARENMAWGMKPGQSTFEAAVASLREILEDASFVSKK